MDAIPRLDGWLTLREAAQRIGMTRAGLHLAVGRGEFSSVHRIGSQLILSEAEVARAAAQRQPRRPGLPVSLPQAKALIDMLTDDDPRGFRGPYPDLRVTRSLREKKLIDDYWSLTDEGRAIAQSVLQVLGAGLPPAATG
jgi:hypothetical protein